MLLFVRKSSTGILQLKLEPQASAARFGCLQLELEIDRERPEHHGPKRAGFGGPCVGGAEALASAYSLQGALQVFRQAARAGIEALVRAGQKDLTQLARYGASEGIKAVGPIRK